MPGWLIILMAVFAGWFVLSVLAGRAVGAAIRIRDQGGPTARNTPEEQ